MLRELVSSPERTGPAFEANSSLGTGLASSLSFPWWMYAARLSSGVAQRFMHSYPSMDRRPCMIDIASTLSGAAPIMP